MHDAHQGQFDVLVVWALDRFGRSMVGNMQAVLDLDRCGVQVVSVREEWLDTSGPVRSLLIAIFGWVAEQERVRLSERTKAGIERARRQGVHVGRPVVRVDVERALELKAQGLPLHDVARRLRVSPATLKRALAKLKKGIAPEGA
jgi:DNA invertase Pin-like site-specific DNA recombinase